MRSLLIMICAAAAAACASSTPSQRPDKPAAQPLAIAPLQESPMSAEAVAVAGDPSPSQAETERAAHEAGYAQPVFRGVSQDEAAAASFATAKAQTENKSLELEFEFEGPTEPQPE